MAFGGLRIHFDEHERNDKGMGGGDREGLGERRACRARGRAAASGANAIAAVDDAWLLIRAFASGCSALTGVEAVSNGLTAFEDPNIVTAMRALALIVGPLAVF